MNIVRVRRYPPGAARRHKLALLYAESEQSILARKELANRLSPSRVTFSLRKGVPVKAAAVRLSSSRKQDRMNEFYRESDWLVSEKDRKHDAIRTFRKYGPVRPGWIGVYFYLHLHAVLMHRGSRRTAHKESPCAISDFTVVGGAARAGHAWLRPAVPIPAPEQTPIRYPRRRGRLRAAT